MDSSVSKGNPRRNSGTNTTNVTTLLLIGNVTVLILTTGGQDLGFGSLESYPPPEEFSLFSSHSLLQSKAFS